MKEGEEEPEGQEGRPQVAELADALRLMKADTTDLLRDMLRGVSMWAATAVLAFLLAGVWLAFAQVLLTFAHPYGSQPIVLDVLYLGYVLSVASACLGGVLLWRYVSLRKRYTRLFDTAKSLR